MYMKKINRITSTMVVLLLLNNSDIKCQDTYNNAITRKYLIERAVNKSYTISTYEAETDKTRYDRYKANEVYLPNLTFNSTYTLLNDDIKMTIPPMTIPVTLPGLGTLSLSPHLDPIVLQHKDIFKSDLTATMVLFTGLKAPLLSKAALHKEKATTFMIEKETTNIIVDVMENFDRLALLDQSVIVLDESSKRLNEETAFAEKAYKNGLISAYDLSKIEIAKQELKAKVIDVNSKRKLVVAKLYQLTSVSKDSLITIHPQLVVYNSTSGNAIDSRPELKALKEAMTANNYKMKSNLASYMPNVYAFGKRELHKEDLSALDPLWYVGVGLKWNVFDGLQNYREMQKSKLDEKIAKNNYDDAYSLLQLNLDKSKYDLEETNQLINVAVEKKNTAVKGLEICIRQYELGLGSITERLAAETDYQNSCLEYLQAIYNQRIATLKLMDASASLSIDKIND